MTTILWTDERVEELKRRWHDGESCSVIGAAMGVSRNAIIGKVHRLGLVKRGMKVSQAQLIKREQKRQDGNASRVARQRNSRIAARGEMMTQELPPPPPPFAGSLHLPFADLRPHSIGEPNQCRFIAAGGPDYLSCGNETLPGESWCGHCRGIVYGYQIKITEEERQRRSRQATRNWKAAEVKRGGTAEAAA